MDTNAKGSDIRPRQCREPPKGSLTGEHPPSQRLPCHDKAVPGNQNPCCSPSPAVSTSLEENYQDHGQLYRRKQRAAISPRLQVQS